MAHFFKKLAEIPSIAYTFIFHIFFILCSKALTIAICNNQYLFKS